MWWLLISSTLEIPWSKYLNQKYKYQSLQNHICLKGGWGGGGGGGGGYGFLFRSEYFFSYNTRVRIYFFLSRKARIFFPEFHIRLYDKNSESDYFFFPPPKSEYFYFFYSRNTLVKISKSKVQISITTKSHLSEITSFCSNLPEKLR
jgi:hypothetical protein